jgi:transcriptional regulator with XRE-family HTH domain
MALTDAPPTGLIDRVKVARRLPTPAAARAIRMGAGVTQLELANELAVDRVTVARWEAGDRTPRGQLRARYVELLEQLAALLHGEGNPSNGPRPAAAIAGLGEDDRGTGRHVRV